MSDSADPPRRLRWSVPAADVSTNSWLDKQENISRSLQLLIRESIQRDGYIDVVNRPVEQLSPRGRPPSTEDQPGENDSTITETDVPSSARNTTAASAEAHAEPQAARPPGNPDVAAGITAMMEMR